VKPYLSLHDHIGLAIHTAERILETVPMGDLTHHRMREALKLIKRGQAEVGFEISHWRDGTKKMVIARHDAFPFRLRLSRPARFS
jgi:hypothetical protein